MKCLIIAAGKGTRLSCKGLPKPLVPLLGMPLIERTIRTATKSGLRDFCVVTGYKGREVRRFLDSLSQTMNVRITSITNEDWEAGNGLSVLKAAHLLNENFILLMADHVFDEDILSRLQDERIDEGEVCLAVDRDLSPNGRVDLEDVTKVLTHGDKIVDIGKQITPYNAYDTGIFLCSPAIFKAIRTSIDLRGDSTLTAAIRVLSDQSAVRPFNITGRFWVDIDDEDGLVRAEKILLSGLSTKSADGWVSRHINRKISSRIFTPLCLKVYPQITPNQVSVVGFLVALVSSLCFFLGQAVAGAVLLQLASILDGSDGEVARLKHLQSQMGDYLDAVMDRYADSLMFAGLAYYALDRLAGQKIAGITWSPFLIFTISILAIVGHLMVSYTSAKSVVNLNYRYKGKWIAAGRGRDLRLFVFFLCGTMAYFHPAFALLGLVLTAVHTNLIVVWRMLHSWKVAQTPGRSLKAGSQTPGRLVIRDLKAVVFDFDGTVADTMPFLTDLAVGLITRNYHLAADEARRRYLETAGLDFASQLEEIFPNHLENAEVAAHFESRKVEDIFNHPLFSYAIPALEFFRHQNLLTFICSSTDQEMLDRYTRLTRIEGLVDRVSGYQTGRAKAAQLTFILQGYRLRPDEVLFVGDSLRDYYLARDKDLKFVGISRDQISRRSFRQHGVPAVNSLEGLVGLFETS